MSKSASGGGRVGMVEKVAYGLGDMASNFYLGFFSVFLLYYYTDIWGLAPGAVATMLMVTRIYDAVADPAIGIIADRTNTRWGKYRPYLLFVAVPYAVFGYLLFLGPDLSPSGKLVYAYLTYGAVMLCYSAINVPYSALLAVISPSSAERTKVTQFRFVFASLGVLLVGALTRPMVEWLGGSDEVLGFRLTIAIFAVLSVACFWITYRFTRERIAPREDGSSVRGDLGLLVANPNWRTLVICGVLFVVFYNTRISSTVFYTKYYMLAGDEKALWWMDTASLIITCGFVGQMFGAMFLPALLRKVDKREAFIGLCVTLAVAMMACQLVPPLSLGLILLLNAIAFGCGGAIFTLLFAMYTDCSEYFDWKAHRNIAGLTVAASMFSLKLGGAMGSAIPGYILEATGFVANQAQGAGAIMGIRVMFNLVPAALCIAAALFALRYRLTADVMANIEADLAQRRQLEGPGA